MPVVVLELGPQGVRVVGGRELLALEDLHRALGPQHGDLGPRPSERVVGAEVARVHDDVRTAERLAQDDRRLRDVRLDERGEEAGARRDDAVALLLGPGQEPRRVDEDRERESRSVAQSPTNHAPLRDASMSIAPARNRGWFATMPIDRPSSRANPTHRFCAPPARSSRNEPTSTMRSITGRTS